MQVGWDLEPAAQILHNPFIHGPLDAQVRPVDPLQGPRKASGYLECSIQDAYLQPLDGHFLSRGLLINPKTAF